MFNFEMPFYIGLSTGISLSFVFFLSLNWFNIVNDSLIGLLHAFFVLPGIIFSLVMSSPYLEEKKILKTSNKFKIFLIALLTIFIGFILGFIMYILLVIFQRV
jgi:magnesium-transporting ATPase (P-type)